jgi:DNA primase large subunit
MAVHRPATPLDARSLYAAYPFLPGAEALLGADRVSIRSLLEDPAYSRPRAIGAARVLAAADDPRATRDVAELDRAGPEERYLSFLFAEIVLAAAPSAAGLRRWAVAEAKRTYARLADAPVEELLEVAGRLGFAAEPAPGGQVALPLVDYLRLSVPVREADFRLSRQDVVQGKVRVGRLRAARLVQEAIRLKLAGALPLAEDVRQRVREQEAELLRTLADRSPAPVARAGPGTTVVRPELFPPCIRKMQRMLQAGENLSHAGRFGLAAFLHRAGADFESIVDAYRGAPDFDESVTRYQVEHITHHDGGAGYTPPECDTLRSHGLCFRDGDPTAERPGDRLRDEMCFRPDLRHPLQYYRWKGGKVVEPGGEPPTAAGAAPDRRASPGRSRSTGPR